MFAKHAKASLWSWVILLVLALLLVSRIALGRRLRLTSSIRRCLSVISAADELSGLVIRGVVLAERIVNHRALVVLVAEAFQVHLAHLIRIS